jgi:putative tryptophan/tyrosine transport system substrate-binding protein
MAIHIRRREFLVTLGGAVATWPPAARAQQLGHVPRIGIVDDAPMWHSFRQALREFGYVEGQSVNYEYRYSKGEPERLASVVGELVRRPVDLIAVYGTPPTEAAKAATTTIPIVMVGVGDPVRAGLVASLARPGANITGNTVLSPDLGGKRLQLLREAIPTVARVAYLTNPDNSATLDVLAELKLAAAAAGMALIGVEFGSATDFDAALAVMLRERTEVLLVSNDPLHQLHAGRIIDLLAKNRIAGMFQSTSRPAALWPTARACRTCSGEPPLTCTESCRAPGLPTCRSSCQPSSIWRSTSKLPARLVSTCRRCSSPALTR